MLLEEIFINILPHLSLKILNNMRTISRYIILLFLLIPMVDANSQDQQEKIDSLVSLLKEAGREWNDYSIPLIEIGDRAVPALVEVVKDRSLEQWNRRVAAMTLNSIHSPLWVEPAKEILFDPTEDPVLRNHATAGLRGFDLAEVKDRLWELFNEESNEFHKSNLANLLMTADTSLAYKAFAELYLKYDAHIQRNALQNLVRLRPGESTMWYLNAVQSDDWMTANSAMDSLITSAHFDATALLEAYHQAGSGEELKWRIVYIFEHRNEPESIPLLKEALQDKSWLVHTEAAVGLSRLNPEKVIPALEELQNDRRQYVRNNITWVNNIMKRK